MINAKLYSPARREVNQSSGSTSGGTGPLVNSKGIMEVTVGCRLRKKRPRMSVDGSGRKRADLCRQRWEGGRDSRWTHATTRSRQEASRQEDKGAGTRGKPLAEVGPQQVRRMLLRESMASRCTRGNR